MSKSVGFRCKLVYEIERVRSSGAKEAQKARSTPMVMWAGAQEFLLKSYTAKVLSYCTTRDTHVNLDSGPQTTHFPNPLISSPVSAQCCERVQSWVPPLQLCTQGAMRVGKVHQKFSTTCAQTVGCESKSILVEIPQFVASVIVNA